MSVQKLFHLRLSLAAITLGFTFSAVPAFALFTPPTNPFITSLAGTVVTLNISSGSISDAQTQIYDAHTANPGAVVVLTLSGTYVVDTNALSLPSYTCLVLSPGAVIKSASPSITATSLIQVSGATNVSIAGGALNGNGANLTGIQVLASSRVDIDNVTVQDCQLDGIALNGNGNSTFDNELTVARSDVSGCANGITMSSATQAVCVDNTTHDNLAYGINLSSARSVVARNSSQSNAVGINVTGSDNVITDNDVKVNGTGIALTSVSLNNLCLSNSISRNTIAAIDSAGTNNTVFDNTLFGAFNSAGTGNNVLPRKAPLGASGQNYFYPPLIDDPHSAPIVNGKDRTDITIGSTTIADVQSQYDAARAAHPADVIVLHLTGATYTGTTTLTLSSYTCVLLSGKIQMTSSLSKGIAAASQSYISVSGGTIDGAGTGGSTHEGIEFATCTMFQIDGMTLQNFGPSNPRKGGHDIMSIRGGATPHIVTRCTLNSGSARGIWTGSGAKNIISGNEISNVNEDGIDFDSHTSGSVAKFNYSHDNARYGIFVEQGDTHNQLIGNVFSRNSTAGIGVWNNGVSADISATQYNTSVCNVCDSNNSKGIRCGSQPGSAFMEDTSHNFFFNNIVHNTTQTGIGNSEIQGVENYYSQNLNYNNGTDYAFSTAGGEVFFNPTIPLSALTAEAENMTPTGTGAPISTVADANASNGALTSLLATDIGQSLKLTMPSIAAGSYQVEFRYKNTSFRGQHDVMIDGSPLGGILDQAHGTNYPMVTLGTVVFDVTGPHTIVLDVTGKAARSLGYTLSADAFSFVPSAPFVFEAENLPATGLGAPISTVSDASASGSALVSLNAADIGQALTLTTTSVPAGTYTIQLQYKQAATAGQHSVTIDGMLVGGVIDQYGDAGYINITLGSLRFTTAGVHIIQLSVTGKNDSSSGYSLSADAITFAP